MQVLFRRPIPLFDAPPQWTVQNNASPSSTTPTDTLDSLRRSRQVLSVYGPRGLTDQQGVYPAGPVHEALYNSGIRAACLTALIQSANPEVSEGTPCWLDDYQSLSLAQRLDRRKTRPSIKPAKLAGVDVFAMRQATE
jgi:hypothetical protein